MSMFSFEKSAFFLTASQSNYPTLSLKFSYLAC